MRTARHRSGVVARREPDRLPASGERSRRSSRGRDLILGQTDEVVIVTAGDDDPWGPSERRRCSPRSRPRKAATRDTGSPALSAGRRTAPRCASSAGSCCVGRRAPAPGCSSCPSTAQHPHHPVGAPEGIGTMFIVPQNDFQSWSAERDVASRPSCLPGPPCAPRPGGRVRRGRAPDRHNGLRPHCRRLERTARLPSPRPRTAAARRDGGGLDRLHPGLARQRHLARTRGGSGASRLRIGRRRHRAGSPGFATTACSPSAKRPEATKPAGRMLRS